jgi:Fe-S oxidoreductase
MPCHLRVQAIGPKTRELLSLVPGTRITTIERCSGHDGTYAVKREFREISMKIARPVVQRVESEKPDVLASDCPMATAQIASGVKAGVEQSHPLSLLARAYGLTA